MMLGEVCLFGPLSEHHQALQRRKELFRSGHCLHDRDFFERVDPSSEYHLLTEAVLAKVPKEKC